MATIEAGRGGNEIEIDMRVKVRAAVSIDADGPRVDRCEVVSATIIDPDPMGLLVGLIAADHHIARAILGAH